MILLTTTSSILRVVTSSVADLDTMAAYVDKTSAGVISEGFEPHARTTAATHTVLAAPPASTSRAVKFLSFRNKHATTANTIQVQLYDGATAYDLFAVTLAAGWALYFADGRGFWAVDAGGRELQNLSANSVGPAVNSTNLVVLASDVINAEAVANTATDITGLSFSVVNGQSYWFRFNIAYTSAATGTGSRWMVSVPTGTLYMRHQYSLTTGSITVVEGTSASDIPAASNGTSATTGSNIATMEGMFVAGGNGTIIGRFASEVTVSAITAKAGSLLEWYRTL